MRLNTPCFQTSTSHERKCICYLNSAGNENCVWAKLAKHLRCALPQMFWLFSNESNYICFFSLSKQNHESGSLVQKMGNVIGLTPSRTGIANGRLVMHSCVICLAPSVRAARETYIIFILATYIMSVSFLIQFGFTKFVGVFLSLFFTFK